MQVQRKTKTKSEISTSSMPDIIFMLLIFFMVTTVMREFDGLNVLIPRAKMIEKLESKRHTSYIWATKDGLVSVDDRIINPNMLRNIMYLKISKDPKITAEWFVKAFNVKIISETVRPVGDTFIITNQRADLRLIFQVKEQMKN